MLGGCTNESSTRSRYRYKLTLHPDVQASSHYQIENANGDEKEQQNVCDHEGPTKLLLEASNFRATCTGRVA